MDDKCLNAVFSIFPTIDSYENFIQQDKGFTYSKSIIHWAYSNRLIDSDDIHSFRSLLLDSKNHLSIEFNNIFEKVESFSSFIDKRAEFFAVKRSVKQFVKSINSFLKANQIQLPEISDVTITRLKTGHADTLVKKNTLRALSLWIGHERHKYGLSYHYENLLKLCNQNTDKKWNDKEGCRVAIGLFSRGDLIDDGHIRWLTEQINKYQEDFDKQSVGTIHSYNTTTLYIDFYKKNEESNQFYHPTTFGECINKAISFSYKLMIRWLLSKHNTSKRYLSIGIESGIFTDFDFYGYIQGILSKELSNDPIIRMTDFARQCIIINDIRVLICPKPKEQVIASGEIVKVWWLDGVWNTIYWDLIPEMIDDKSIISDEKLRSLLWVSRNQMIDINKPNAVKTFLQSHNNTILGLEIAKILYFKRKFIEANEILRIILCRDPKNIVARTLRISIHWNNVVNASTYSLAEMYFRLIEKEVDFIEEYCENKDEDYYCEYGLGIVGYAVTMIRFIRKEVLDKTMIQKVISLLSDAESVYEKSKVISSTGSRSIYLLLNTKSLKHLLMNDDSFISNFPSESYLIENDQPFKTVTNEIFTILGWLHPDLKYPNQKKLFYEDRAYQAIKLHDDSTFLRTYVPGVAFCYAVLLWDFNPFITRQTVNNVMELLQKAYQTAAQLEKGLCIYSVTRFNGEIMPVKTFQKHIERCILELQKVLKQTAFPENDDEIIQNPMFKGIKLCLLNIYSE